MFPCSHFLFPSPNRPLSAMYGLCSPPGSQQFFSWIKERVSAAPSAAPPPEDAADPVPPPPIPLGHRAGGIQGGPPPCAGGPGTRRFLAYLCLLSLREKVGRGAGRSARMVGAGTTVPQKTPPGAGRSARIGRCWGCRPAKNSPGCRAERLHREVLGLPSPQNPSGEAERKKGGAGGCTPSAKKPLAFCRKI